MRHFQNKEANTQRKPRFLSRVQETTKSVKITKTAPPKAPTPPVPEVVEPTYVEDTNHYSEVKHETEEMNEEELKERQKIGSEMTIKRIEATVTASTEGIDLDDAISAAQKMTKSTDPNSADVAANVIRSMGYSSSKGNTVLVQKLKDSGSNTKETINAFLSENADLLVKRTPPERTQIIRNAIGGALKATGGNASRRDTVNVSVLRYLLCSMGERLSESEFELLITDLDMNSETGEIPVPSLLYLLNGQGGYPPSDEKKRQRRVLLRAQRAGSQTVKPSITTNETP